MIVSKQINNTDYYSAEEIRAKYQNLYTILRNYIWSFDVVEAIAHLEVSIYHRFPDANEMKKCLDRLHAEIYDTYAELSAKDETELEDAYDELASAIDNYLDTGCELYTVNVLPADSDMVASNNSDDVDKHKYSMGDIIKETNIQEANDNENY